MKVLIRAGLAAIFGLVLLAPTSAGAAPPRTPSPAPAAAVVGSVTVPESNSAQFTVTNPYQSGVETLATVSGPGTQSPLSGSVGTAPYVFVDITGLGRVTGLQPASTYTVTLRRHRFYDPRTNRAVSVTSAPTTFSLTTLTLAESRPSAPVISLSRLTTTNTLIGWAPSIDNTSSETQISYRYSIDGAPQVSTGCAYCFGTTGASVRLPAPGTSITVTVVAVDAAGVVSLPSNPLVITG